MKVIDANSGEFVEQGVTSTDAFGRIRVSDPGLRVDTTFTYDKQPLLFDEVLTGLGSAIFDSNLRAVYLSTGGVNAINASILRLHYHTPYTPGNSQFIALTGNLNPDNITNWTNLKTEIGYGNSKNAVGFRYDANGVSIFLRSSISGTIADLVVVKQSDWNVNKGTNIDWTKSQIFLIDFQSLGVGRIRFYVDSFGEAILLHSIQNDNVRVGPYWQSGSLAPYWSVQNTGVSVSTGRVLAICCTVKSEGGNDLKDMPGIPFSASNSSSTKTASTTLVPIVSVQLKTTISGIDNHGLIRVEDLSLMGTNPFHWKLIVNPTLSGAGFTSVDDNSICNYDITASGISGGRTILQGYVGGGAGNTRSSLTTPITGKIPLSVNSESTVGDIVTIAAQRVGNSDSAVSAAINWQEIK